jgi:anti-sigma regulatory factor (Ser/Thr protein kinase)
MEPAAAVTLPSTEQAPGVARRFVRDAGGDWPERVLEAALLVVSEAVTNAVRHGSGRIQLCVAADDRLVRIEVTDEGPQLPLHRSASEDALGDGGRGLHLLDALTTRWGSAPRGDAPGKTVWMEIGRS